MDARSPARLVVASPARLVLEDGVVFRGVSVGAPGTALGEVVFNTSHTGYQEILTDPSYRGQVVVLTCPQIGNTGVNRYDNESSGPWAEGLVMRDCSPLASSHRADASLQEYLREHGVPALAGVDTRALTRRIRTQGAMRCALTTEAELGDAEILERVRSSPSMQGRDLAREVSCTEASEWTESLGRISAPRHEGWSAQTAALAELGVLDEPADERTGAGRTGTGRPHGTVQNRVAASGAEKGQAPFRRRKGANPVSAYNPHDPGSEPCRPHVVAVDYGMKATSPRILLSMGCRVTRVPATYSAEAVLELQPDGVFLSNGPGDPAAVTYGVQTVAGLLGRVPIFGICLGHQILSLACGARTFKLPFGHRGSNHPVRRESDGRVEITSQNHGFAVDPATLPAELEVTHLNLNDGTVEGVRHRGLPAWSVQYHPEAAPGPVDSMYLFRDFLEAMS